MHGSLPSAVRAFLFVGTLAASTAVSAGCGFAPREFSNQVRDADGRPILLEDVAAIVDDADLSDDQKRDALRALGVEDETLIDALLTL